jgi:hypothetical protein
VRLQRGYGACGELGRQFLTERLQPSERNAPLATTRARKRPRAKLAAQGSQFPEASINHRYGGIGGVVQDNHGNVGASRDGGSQPILELDEANVGVEFDNGHGPGGSGRAAS